MSFYERRLPHWHPDGRDLFLTWRLHASLPSNRYVPTNGLRGGKAFVGIDQVLDRATFGPTWLRKPEVAKVVIEALTYGATTLNQYLLHSFVIMPNHVHILITPREGAIENPALDQGILRPRSEQAS